MAESCAVGGNIARALEVEGAAAILEGRKNDTDTVSFRVSNLAIEEVLRGEVAKEVQGTANCLERAETVAQVI